MAHTIAVLSSKGGVGKSTITCGLAAVLATFIGPRRRILVIDAGGQHNTLDYLEGCAGELPAIDTAAADDYATLSRLRSLDSGHAFQIIDLPGYARAEETAAVLTGSGGTPVADLVLVPMLPSEFDLESVVPFALQTVEPTGIDYRVVLSKVSSRSRNEAVELQAQLRDSGVRTAVSLIREYRGIQHAQRERRPITTYGGKHDTARLAEDDFRALTREAIRLLGLRAPRIPTRDQPSQEAHRG